MVTQIQPPAVDPFLSTAKKSAAVKTNATAGATNTPTTTGSSDGDIGSTFLSLLVQELQNQDPTDPMDSTAMVGQMISLNQLDQLVSINQAVGGASATSGAKAAAVTGTPATNEMPTSSALAGGQALPLPQSSTGAARQVLPGGGLI